MSIKSWSELKANKIRAGLPLAAFIRNRQSGVLGRLTFSQSSLPSGYLDWLKHRSILNAVWQALAKIEEERSY